MVGPSISVEKTVTSVGLNLLIFSGLRLVTDLYEVGTIFGLWRSVLNLAVVFIGRDGSPIKTQSWGRESVSQSVTTFKRVTWWDKETDWKFQSWRPTFGYFLSLFRFSRRKSECFYVKKWSLSGALGVTGVCLVRNRYSNYVVCAVVVWYVRLNKKGRFQGDDREVNGVVFFIRILSPIVPSPDS